MEEARSEHERELAALRERYEGAMRDMENALRRRAEEVVGALEGQHKGEVRRRPGDSGSAEEERLRLPMDAIFAGTRRSHPHLTLPVR